MQAHTNTCSAHIHTHQHRQARTHKHMLCSHTHTPAQTGTHTHTNTYIHKPFETFPLSHICPSLEQGQTKVKDRRTALEQTEPKQNIKVYYLCHTSATPTVYLYILHIIYTMCTYIVLYKCMPTLHVNSSILYARSAM